MESLRIPVIQFNVCYCRYAALTAFLIMFRRINKCLLLQIYCTFDMDDSFRRTNKCLLLQIFDCICRNEEKN